MFFSPSQKPLILRVPQSESFSSLSDIMRRIQPQASTSGLLKKGSKGAVSELSQSMMDLSVHKMDKNDVAVPRFKVNLSVCTCQISLCVCIYEEKGWWRRNSYKKSSLQVTKILVLIAETHTELSLDHFDVNLHLCDQQCFDPSQMTPALALMKKRNDDLKPLLYSTPKNFVPRERPRSSSYALDWRSSLAELDRETGAKK